MEEKDMEYRIATISGDGIGPEIVREAKKVLDKTGQKYGHKFNYEEVLMGGISIDTYGVPLTDEALETARRVTLFFSVQSVEMSATPAGTMLPRT